MKRNYWEKIAPTYGEEIFDVLQNDKKALIRKAINKYASKNKSVVDIGCAIGKWLPVLSPLFKKVVALDISAKNLSIAKKLYSHLSNVEFVRVDMSGNRTSIHKSDVGICINAILTPHQKDRNIFFASLPKCIKKGGHIIITIPSLESWMLSSVIQQQYRIDQRAHPRTVISLEALRKWNNIRQGNADIDGVPHKHYLKEEMQILLEREGFKVMAIEKIEYNWDTEFFNPPSWLKDPRPWDWMVVAKLN